jgi:hypothetical protein
MGGAAMNMLPEDVDYPALVQALADQCANLRIQVTKLTRDLQSVIDDRDALQKELWKAERVIREFMG